MVTITTALDPRLHAHTSGHWRTKAKPTKQLREIAKLLAMERSNRAIKGRAVVDYLFFVPDRRRRDASNMVQMCKPIVDGVVDAGMIEGDHWEVLRIGRVDVVLGSKLEVKLTFRGE